MQIREFRQEDLPQLRSIHAAQGMDYIFPNLADPLFHIKLVGEENGQIVNAGLAHLTSEIYFLADMRIGTPRERFDNFLAMEREGCRVAYHHGGLSDLHAFLPPQVVKPFGRRLARLGWVPEHWTPMVKFLKP